MRGIAFIGGEGPAGAVCGRLAGAADLVVAADSGFLAAQRAGISPGWIVGDMDSLGDPAPLDDYPPEQVIRYPHEKDFTDTELALKLLWERGCDEVWLLGGGGGRTDHFLAIRSLFEREPAPDRWITRAEDIRRLRRGKRLIFPETEGAGEALKGISVFPLGTGPWKAESLGLKWPLDRLVWDRGFFGISNEAPSGHFSISAVRGDFLILAPLI
ncbi:MAG: thiamine diphosphokinase [Treponema sp.]|jgi:thiamine pyrophosphokinase|nr:thiamine diphosphokinase [Treponema sp.]